MIRNNKIYFKYEGYEDRFGQAQRPAVVRYRKVYQNNQYGEESSSFTCSLYIDGRVESNEISGNYIINDSSCSLVIVSPFHSDDKELADYNLEARSFRANAKNDWFCLFHDTSEFQRMGDKIAYANLAIALRKYQISIPIILDALNSFNEDVKTRIIGLINNIGFSLSLNKIQQISELNSLLGNPTQLFFPNILEQAANQYGIEYENLCVHSLVDKLFEAFKDHSIDNPCEFIHFIQWLNDGSMSISLNELENCFAFLGEANRSLAIKRYFFDVKKGALTYDSHSLQAFSSQNYQYYSSLRYVFEKWPGNRNVSTEFLLDCLNTYQQTNQESFQISEGILDWSIQKSIELNRPIEMKFYDWLCYCQGGVILNNGFQGFANFEIQYELDEMMFEEDSLTETINTILNRHCSQASHTVLKLGYDDVSGEYDHYPNSKRPRFCEDRIRENLWRGRDKYDLSFIRQFVDLSKSIIIISPEMMDDSSFYDGSHKLTEIKKGVLSQYCEQFSHEETRLVIDETLGVIKRDPSTGTPIMRSIIVPENRWRLKNRDDINVLSIREDIDESQYTYFTLELIQESLTLEKLEEFLIHNYNTLTPYISDRESVELVRMFAIPVKMKANLNDSSHLGVSPGVDELEVKRRVRARLIELLGESLECDYNQALYQEAQTDSQYRRDANSSNCFETKIKRYYREREIYCAPSLSDFPNLLTGRKCAICQGDMCFVTSIKKDPQWEELSLIHILEIIGYHVLEETEAGYIPNQAYNQFVNQINKAIRFYKRLICKECGHILFPAQQLGRNRFKCLLPACSEYNKVVYLSYCHDCKKGLIDSRETKQCPNGLYICPSCNSCCSNAFFDGMASKYRRQGLNPPAFISSKIGKGHKDLNMYFCPTCGTQKTEIVDKAGKHEYRCLVCHPIEEGNSESFDSMEGLTPFVDKNEILEIDPWA